MDLRVGSILPTVMVIISLLTNTKSLMALDVTAQQTPIGNAHSEAGSGNEQICTLCEEYASQVVQYFSSSETQSDIISTLHQVCSHLHPLKQQCISLVDNYVPPLFMEIATIQPELFCKKVKLCGLISTRIQQRDDACMICHRLVTEALIKLEDPETQLKIIQALLKECSKVENFVQECKKLVFEYGPIILSSAEKYLETTDICVAARICKAGREASRAGELLLSAA